MYTYKATLTRIIDGDTYEADIDLGFHVHIRARLRLAATDCPELPTPQGWHARAQAAKWWQHHHGQAITRITHHDRYGRNIAYIEALNDPTDTLAAYLTKQGGCKPA